MNEEITIPRHVGIIMDGNGRWAKEKGLARTAGHKAAISTVKELCIYMNDLGVECISLYAFSTENFKREEKEVNFLMNLFIETFEKEFDFVKEKKIKVVFSGRKKPLSNKVLKVMEKLTNDTKDYTGAVLNICLNYGSHMEMVDMTRKVCELYKNGDITLEDIDEGFIQQNLYQNLPPLDFVIRTSGELRLSNFMMYQASYAEFYFSKVYFPDFNVEELKKALEDFSKRNRRFGGVK